MSAAPVAVAPVAPLPAAFLTRPIAHRALHDLAAGRPENSLAAVRAAVARGYGIEIDVQLSADGRAMVFHDDTLERLTSAQGPVTALTAAALQALPLLGTDQRAPELAQVLAEVTGRVPLLIEVKDQSLTMGAVDGRLEAAVVQALAGYAGLVAVMSFNPDSVAHLARLAPDLPRGLITCAYDEDDWTGLAPARRAQLREIPDFGPVGAAFLSHQWQDLGRARVQALKAAGAALLCWTVRSPEAEAEARRLADNITFEGYAAALPEAAAP